MIRKILALSLVVGIVMSVLSCSKPEKYNEEDLWLQSFGAQKHEIYIVTTRPINVSPIVSNVLSTINYIDSVYIYIEGDADMRDGFEIAMPHERRIDITVYASAGLIYAAFYLQRMQACGREVSFPVREVPSFDWRMLDHWDNLDGTIERGYAGHSLWNWESLPDTASSLIVQYALFNASIGINAVVLNNVNASPEMLDEEHIAKISTIAKIFSYYGIRVLLSVNFATPQALGYTTTADPLDESVRAWWQDKVKELKEAIPNFCGFLVKANSEGLPGPLDYGRTHADGANMLAEALAPYRGVVLWRAFVYKPSDDDRAKQAYQEFVPLDGQFADNVIVQIKNGPIDFQPREAFSPLFGAMPKTQQAVELQITQEYTGHAVQLCYLTPMWKETLDSHTYRNDTLQTIADLTKVRRTRKCPSVIAGVANVGDDINWCGHPLANANWYAFGRLAWNTTLSSDSIAKEWAALSFPATTQDVRDTIVDMLMQSREAVVDYMMPMGLHHLFAFGHHYGPEPWCDVEGAREDWLPRYYHKADSVGIGFNRTTTGSNAVSQYAAPLDSIYNNINTCPDELLLWFHHVEWTHKMKSGRTLWDELCFHYNRGLTTVAKMHKEWQSINGKIDAKLWNKVDERLTRQELDARWWHDACLLYFQQFCRLPIPQGTKYDLDKMKDFHINIDNYTSATEGYREK
jgi:alpha-glucuronidase